MSHCQFSSSKPQIYFPQRQHLFFSRKIQVYWELFHNRNISGGVDINTNKGIRDCKVAPYLSSYKPKLSDTCVCIMTRVCVCDCVPGWSQQEACPQ